MTTRAHHRIAFALSAVLLAATAVNMAARADARPPDFPSCSRATLAHGVRVWVDLGNLHRPPARARIGDVRLTRRADGVFVGTIPALTPDGYAYVAAGRASAWVHCRMVRP